LLTVNPSATVLLAFTVDSGSDTVTFRGATVTFKGVVTVSKTVCVSLMVVLAVWL